MWVPHFNRIHLLTVVLFACAGYSVSAEDARLRVQPDLCMTTVQQPECQLQLQLDWATSVNDNYCITLDAAERAVECWQAASNGATTDERTVAKSFTYVLQDDESVVHARTAVKVLAARSKDRRRNRRRRHVWSVL